MFVKNADFNLMLKLLNPQYRELFRTIPCITDFSCTRDEYITAMKLAIETRIPIENYLVKSINPAISDVEI